MTDDYGEVLSRFFDGEPVDDTQLEAALAQPDAAALLWEFAHLRRLVRADLGVPSAEFRDRMRQRLRTPAWKRLLHDHWVPAALAASLLVAAALGYSVRSWREGGGRPSPAGVPAVATGPRVAPTVPAAAAGATPKAGRPQPATVRPAIPVPRARVPFAEWRDGASPN